MKTRWNIGLLALSFLIPFLCITNYTLNYFYVVGGSMLDGAWFSYLAAHSTTWPPQNPPWLGGTFFSTHVTPLFVLLSGVYQGLAALGVHMPDTVWFSLTQGLWVGVIGISIFLLQSPEQIQRHKYAGLLLAVLGALNGISLVSTTFFPHIEIAIPAFFIAFFALYLKGNKKLALTALALGLFTREDAGLHYFGVFILLALCQRLFPDPQSDAKPGIPSFGLALLCLGYSITAIVLQKTYWNAGTSTLTLVYLGQPAFAHLNARFIAERISTILFSRTYISVPIAFTIFWAIRRKTPSLAVGAVSVLPWIVLSLCAISNFPGHLELYYSFPIAIAVLWPVIHKQLNGSDTSDATKGNRMDRAFPALIIILSIVLFSVSGSVQDRRPWTKFLPTWYGHITANHQSLENFLDQNPGIRFTTTDSVAALLNEHIHGNEWQFFINVPAEYLDQIDALIFQPKAWTSREAQEKANAHGLTNLCHIGNSNFFAYTRHPGLAGCQQP